MSEGENVWGPGLGTSLRRGLAGVSARAGRPIGGLLRFLRRKSTRPRIHPYQNHARRSSAASTGSSTLLCNQQSWTCSDLSPTLQIPRSCFQFNCARPFTMSGPSTPGAKPEKTMSSRLLAMKVRQDLQFHLFRGASQPMLTLPTQTVHATRCRRASSSSRKRTILRRAARRPPPCRKAPAPIDGRP